MFPEMYKTGLSAPYGGKICLESEQGIYFTLGYALFPHHIHSVIFLFGVKSAAYLRSNY